MKHNNCIFNIKYIFNKIVNYIFANAFFNSTYMIDGLTYIFEKANKQFPSRPVVINLSAGGIHTGPHDGSSLFEQNLDNLLSEPGRAVVVAAGNDGNQDIHHSHTPILQLFQTVRLRSSLGAGCIYYQTE